MAMPDTFERIYEIVKQIPKGKVATYGQIAVLAGNNRWARVVGYALHVNREPDNIPCFRVVNRFGGMADGFAFGGPENQRMLLEMDGVTFLQDGRVNMDKHLWMP
ncbi:MAG: MGMT family protein [Oscillospiraceae bacterium]|jgi:methylated-DNA-protein-cysteine methyltransferase-like protein|nr:MGMT family protein [Oscillospiraceae bacterium]